MKTARTDVGADAAALAPLQSFLCQFWSDADLPDADRFPFELALEEVFMNVVMHGSTGLHDVRVAVTLSADEDRQVEMVIRDGGNLFNPLQAPVPDTDAPNEARPVGGLGIHLVITLMDDVRYSADGGQNCLTLRKRVAADNRGA